MLYEVITQARVLNGNGSMARQGFQHDWVLFVEEIWFAVAGVQEADGLIVYDQGNSYNFV